MTKVQQIRPAILLEAPAESSSETFTASIRKVQAAAETLGLYVSFSRRDPIENEVWVEPELRGRPVIAYGSIQFIKAIKEPIYPGAYGFNGTDWLTMSAHVSRNRLLNEHFQMTSWGDFARNYEWFTATMESQIKTRKLGIFVRPSSDKKIFPAQVVWLDNYPEEIENIGRFSAVMPETLCVVSAVRDFGTEYRFWIVDRKVVGYSAYPTFGKPMGKIEEPPRTIIKLADDVAQLEWQPDSCYTVDLAMDNLNYPKIIEMNSFCCSGVYDSDFTKILEAVVDKSIRDFYEV